MACTSAGKKKQAPCTLTVFHLQALSLGMRQIHSLAAETPLNCPNGCLPARSGTANERLSSVGVHFSRLSLSPNMLFSLDFFFHPGNSRVLISRQKNTSCRRGVALRGFANLSDVLMTTPATGSAAPTRPSVLRHSPAAAETRTCFSRSRVKTRRRANVYFPTGLFVIQLLMCNE